MTPAQRPRHCRHCLGKCPGNCMLDEYRCIHGWNGKHPRVLFRWRMLWTRRWWHRVLWGR